MSALDYVQKLHCIIFVVACKTFIPMHVNYIKIVCIYGINSITTTCNTWNVMNQFQFVESLLYLKVNYMRFKIDVIATVQFFDACVSL